MISEFIGLIEFFAFLIAIVLALRLFEFVVDFINFIFESIGKIL